MACGMAKGTPWGEVSGTTKVRFRRKSYKFLLRGFMRLFGLGYVLLELLLIGLLGLARNGLRLGCFGVGHDRGFLPTQRSRTLVSDVGEKRQRGSAERWKMRTGNCAGRTRHGRGTRVPAGGDDYRMCRLRGWKFTPSGGWTFWPGTGLGGGAHRPAAARRPPPDALAPCDSLLFVPLRDPSVCGDGSRPR